MNCHSKELNAYIANNNNRLFYIKIMKFRKAIKTHSKSFRNPHLFFLFSFDKNSVTDFPNAGDERLKFTAISKTSS